MEKQIDNKAKALIAEVAQTLLDCSKENQNCVSMVTLAISLYEKGLLRQPWHDVSDPPKTSGLYIVCTDKGSVFTAHFYADCGRLLRQLQAVFGSERIAFLCVDFFLIHGQSPSPRSIFSVDSQNSTT